MSRELFLYAPTCLHGTSEVSANTRATELPTVTRYKAGSLTRQLAVFWTVSYTATTWTYMTPAAVLRAAGQPSVLVETSLQHHDMQTYGGVEV
jgi:hypothetical protein